MRESVWRVTWPTVALVALLSGLALLPVPVYSRTDTSVPKKLLRTLHKDELNREAREQQTAGYYEGLLNEGSRVSGMNAFVTGNRRFTPESWMLPGRRHRGDFLYWDMPPNLNARNPDNPNLDHATNSHGLADKEYSLEKPPGTWRVALIGDSVARGQGAPFGKNFEFLLEARLNENYLGPRGRRVEIVNFAVGGYRITQLVDVANERVPAFSPDVYLFTLTELSVFRDWGEHLATLVQNGIDLKYDYLRELVQKAGIRPSDPAGTIAAKLARFRIPTLRWVIQELKAAARRDDAELLILLLPNGTPPEMLDEQFLGVRELLDELDVRSLDILDTFADVDDRLQYQVSRRNSHPNEKGHRRLYERLMAEILGNAEYSRLFCGTVIGPTAQ
jgi:lysophospholipase L1-like esterase